MNRRLWICKDMDSKNDGYTRSAFWRQEPVWTQTRWMWRKDWAGTTSPNFCQPISPKNQMWPTDDKEHRRKMEGTPHLLDFCFD